MALQVTELISEFREADAQAYIETYPFADLRYQTVFPNLFTPNLSWKSIEAITGAKVAADVVAYNSRAPRKGRNIPGTKQGDIPKIEIARDKVESDFNTFRGLQQALSISQNGSPTNNQVMRQIINWMYEDGAFVVDGVKARLEWIAKRIASTGKYSLTLTNNEAGVQTKVDVDFGIPNANKVNAATAWTTSATADPIADIRARVNAARTKGRVLKYMFMDKTAFDNLVATEKFQKFCATYVANALNLQALPDLDTANAALTRQNLPTIIIWDSFVTIEGKDGTQSSESGWEEGMVAFSETDTLGDTQYTMSADEFVNVGKATKTKSDIVLVKMWGEEDPITVITKGVAYATPVLNNAKNIHILNTTP